MGIIDLIRHFLSVIGLVPSTNLPSIDPPINGISLTGRDPDRLGTFLIGDLYPPDIGPLPPFENILNREIQGKEFVGCVLKSSEGLGWGTKNEEWFKTNWRRMREIGGQRYGVEWFRGAYHFLRFTRDGAKQADYFCDIIESAGGWGPGDLMPWVDAEEGGQGTWAGGERLSDITDPIKRARLTKEVRTCIEGFVRRFKERTGLRIAVYGRGIFRDLRMTNCNFGEDSWVNPGYTRIMPKMEKYGVPLSHISLWQLCGDGEAYADGFPAGDIKGWGTNDYSVFIDGPNATTLKRLREVCLAKAPA